jgi:N-methylhydantoinase A
MHAADLAAALDIDTVLVPRLAGVLSALGMLLADATRDAVQTVLTGAGPAGRATASEVASRLEARLRDGLAADGASPGSILVSHSADMRYRGQSYELTVPLAGDPAAAFDAAHQQRYGYSDPAREKELVNVRVRASVAADRPSLPREAVRAYRPAPLRLRPARFDGRRRETAHFQMEQLRPGAHGEGPAVIAGEACTTVVPPAWTWRVDEFGNLVLTRGARRRARAPGRPR